ncbi:MAG: hypothetical protein OIF47_08755 [Marinibacterium sp.]|nr:hypothetical protein [Marinibacterium sp.]
MDQTLLLGDLIAFEVNSQRFKGLNKGAAAAICLVAVASLSQNL